ncbi:MAG TPA: hypothetical protein DEA96_19205 [Leptospiraceae bacterium]|nr:hypothetical protein [Spirochaetaceae bacterium]HBS07109.1 hypothetical protein [Leptospiraceae bacterium]
MPPDTAFPGRLGSAKLCLENRKINRIPGNWPGSAESAPFPGLARSDETNGLCNPGHLWRESRGS